MKKKESQTLSSQIKLRDYSQDVSLYVWYSKDNGTDISKNIFGTFSLDALDQKKTAKQDGFKLQNDQYVYIVFRSSAEIMRQKGISVTRGGIQVSLIDMWKPGNSTPTGKAATAGAIAIAIMVGGLIVGVCVVAVICMICKKPKKREKGE